MKILQFNKGFTNLYPSWFDSRIQKGIPKKCTLKFDKIYAFFMLKLCPLGICKTNL